MVAVGPLESDTEDFHLWPENVSTWQLWLDLQTDWNTDMSGRTGLDKPAVEAVMRMRRIPPRERAGLLSALQGMERAALKEWAVRDE